MSPEILRLPLFWLIAAAFGSVQILLIVAALRLRRRSEAPAGLSLNPATDLAWTLGTAAATIALLVFAYRDIAGL